MRGDIEQVVRPSLSFNKLSMCSSKWNHVLTYFVKTNILKKKASTLSLSHNMTKETLSVDVTLTARGLIEGKQRERNECQSVVIRLKFQGKILNVLQSFTT